MRPVRVLIVEDDPSHQALLELAVRAGNSRALITTAESGQAFLDQISRQTYDCVVLDFNLVDGKASDLLQVLQQLHPNCPAIVVSSSTHQNVVIKSMRNGSDDFLPKHEAIKGTVLWDMIARVIGTRRRKEAERRRIERREKQLLELVDEDPLTGLYNRRHLENLLNGRRRAVLGRRGCATAWMADIDHFKSLNDTYGHAFGDTVLKQVASILRTQTPNDGFAWRWGGEEFLLLYPAEDIAQSMVFAEQLRTAVEALDLRAGSERVKVTISAGVSHFLPSELNQRVISRADEALYFAKRHGRNRVCIWELANFESLVRRTRSSWITPQEHLSRLIECARPYLGPTQYEHLTSHSRKVSEAVVAAAGNITDRSIDKNRLRFAGLCHDLGKFLIPEDVLAKAGPLSKDERLLLDRHPRDGAEMSTLLDADSRTADSIRFHHVRFDGRGASKESRSANIPLEGWLLNTADAFDAMVSGRPYQPARTPLAALSELQRERGAQFDPQAVDAVRQWVTTNSSR